MQGEKISCWILILISLGFGTFWGCSSTFGFGSLQRCWSAGSTFLVAMNLLLAGTCLLAQGPRLLLRGYSILSVVFFSYRVLEIRMWGFGLLLWVSLYHLPHIESFSRWCRAWWLSTSTFLWSWVLPGWSLVQKCFPWLTAYRGTVLTTE